MSVKFQLIEGGGVAREIRRSVHSQLFVLGQTPREVGRRYGIRDADTVQIALEVEREFQAERERRIWAAARLSPLPPAMARRAA